MWRPVPSHPGYEASTWGRVRNARTGHVLRPQRCAKGYVKVHLGRAKQERVHVLVCEAFHGPRPPAHDADHRDWDKTNNTPANLRWLPSVLNCARQYRYRHAGRWVEEDTARPDDWTPLSPEQDAALDQQLAAAGW